MLWEFFKTCTIRLSAVSAAAITAIARDACLSLLFPKDRRLRLIDLPIEKVIKAGPGVDLGPANLTVETARMLVWMLFFCRRIIHPAVGAAEIFGRPYASGHPATMPRQSSIFQPFRLPQSNRPITQEAQHR